MQKVCQATKIGKVFVHFLFYSIATVNYVVPQVFGFYAKNREGGHTFKPYEPEDARLHSHLKACYFE